MSIHESQKYIKMNKLKFIVQNHEFLSHLRKYIVVNTLLLLTSFKNLSISEMI